MQDYEQYDALGLADLVRRREVSAMELLFAAHKRAQARNPKLNAIVHDWYEEAQADVKAGLPEGPFTGVPFLLKDLNLHWAGRKLTNGSKLYKDHVSEISSTLVERYIAAGLVTFGRTNSPEFGLTASTEPALYGPTRNPWNLDHTPGGSSGGASAAVAAGIVPMANATDGGGSIRIPAACAGLFGMKPSRARTPVGPHTGEGWGGMSIPHVVSWTVRDSAAMLDATAGAASGDPYFALPQEGSYLAASMTPPKRRLRIAVSTTAPNGAVVHPDCIKAVQDAAKLLESLGHHVEWAAPTIDIGAITEAQVTIMASSTKMVCEARAAELGKPLEEGDVEHITMRMIENASAMPISAFPMAQRTVHGLGRTFAEFHQDYDVWLTPTLGQPPVKLGLLDMNEGDIATYVQTVTAFACFTGFMNMTGAPSMSLPLGMSGDGLPIGVMATGPVGAEAMLFSLAGEVERAAPWIHQRPPSVD